MSLLISRPATIRAIKALKHAQHHIKTREQSANWILSAVRALPVTDVEVRTVLAASEGFPDKVWIWGVEGSQTLHAERGKEHSGCVMYARADGQTFTSPVKVNLVIHALNRIRELNTTGEDENGYRWAHSDLIDQEITCALSALEGLNDG